MKFNTKCVHGSGKPDSTGAISPAIYMSSTFSHPKLGDTTGYQYSRESNPTRDRLEQLIAGLEEGTDASPNSQSKHSPAHIKSTVQHAL